MIEVTLTDEMKSNAKRKADELGVLNNSVTSGRGNYIGFLGEEVARLVLGGKEENTFDYDMKVGRKKVEVKTKRTKYKPKPGYECPLIDTGYRQKCDYYCFVRVDPDKNKAYYLGVISNKGFWSKAKYHKAGSKPTKGAWWRYAAPTYSVTTKDLRQKFRT